MITMRYVDYRSNTWRSEKSIVNQTQMEQIAIAHKVLGTCMKDIKTNIESIHVHTCRSNFCLNIIHVTHLSCVYIHAHGL